MNNKSTKISNFAKKHPEWFKPNIFKTRKGMVMPFGSFV
jgi:hypothetical protein